MQINKIPSPKTLGLPAKFKDWRNYQDKAILDGLNSDYRFIGQLCPTGFGKSAVYMAQALIRGGRTAFLTSTKGLQEQLQGDFESVGLVQLMGKANYTCEANPTHTCEDGSNGKCPYKGSSMCSYSAAKFEASDKPFVNINYSCWIALNKYGNGLGNFDCLVLDEAHNAPDELANAMKVQISHKEIREELKKDWPDERSWEDMEAWKYWAGVMFQHVTGLVQELKEQIKIDPRPSGNLLKKYRHMFNLQRKLADLATCKPNFWVVDTWDFGFQFDPINPSAFGERVLFRGIPKIIATSATLRSKTLRMLGIMDGEYDFYEYPSNFDPRRSPVYYVPTVKMHYKMSLEDMRYWVHRIDQIISTRLDRKGIIHVGSFQRRDFLISHSRFSEHMISNYVKQGDITADIVDRFKSMPPPAILVSPSVTTGYDFPGDLCRYQIIGKIQFPSTQSKIEKARQDRDKTRGLYHAMQHLVQATGRAGRSEDDWQEVFIIDDNMEWFWKSNKGLAPKDFHHKYQQVQQIPAPLEVV